jgi:hypothetical protein
MSHVINTNKIATRNNIIIVTFLAVVSILTGVLIAYLGS